MQALLLSLVACETSAEDILELTKHCQVGLISGEDNAKYRDFSAGDILEELYQHNNYKLSVHKAKINQDDGAAMVYLTVFVPEDKRTEVEAWLAEQDESATISWGVSTGDTVEMPEPRSDDNWSHDFEGTVIGFRLAYAQVEDGDGDVFDIEPERLSTVDDD